MIIVWIWILLMSVNIGFSLVEVIDAPMFVALTYLTTILCIQLSRGTNEKEPTQ